ncbi:MAG: TfuA-like protein, partial [Alphaproteobacteria bacterium]
MGYAEVPAHTPVVFGGISLSHSAISDVVAAEVRPPIASGDLDRLHGTGRTIVVIDGELGPDAMVSAEEIERAIARGLDVWGASSVGALRAAELRGRGMYGSGWVYRAFCSGRIAGTDEIAVLYDPRDLRPLTLPLVTIRFWLDRLLRGRVVTDRQAAHVMNAV